MKILSVIAVCVMLLSGKFYPLSGLGNNIKLSRHKPAVDEFKYQAKRIVYRPNGAIVQYPLQADQTAFIESTLKFVNAVRTKGCSCGITEMPAAGPLIWNDSLYNAALAHANDMLKQNYFSHTSKDGRRAVDRIKQTGYGPIGYKTFFIGENIAEGQDHLKEVIDDWFNSEGHCKNLMNPKFKELGLAQAGGYWVMEFGGRTPFTKAEQEQIKNGELKPGEK